MEPTAINLYCSNCKPSESLFSSFVRIQREKIVITLDLMRNEWVFEAVCPRCLKDISNSRPL